MMIFRYFENEIVFCDANKYNYYIKYYKQDQVLIILQMLVHKILLEIFTVRFICNNTNIHFSGYSIANYL